MVKITEYFEGMKGTGILATSNGEGEVDTAIYASPHVIGEDEVAFIMRDRLSYKNVQSNPKAAYMFIEKTEKYAGVRLYLEKVREDDDPQVVEEMRRRTFRNGNSQEKCRVVYFKVTRSRPLIGDK